MLFSIIGIFLSGSLPISGVTHAITTKREIKVINEKINLSTNDEISFEEIVISQKISSAIDKLELDFNFDYYDWGNGVLVKLDFLAPRSFQPIR